MSEPTLTQLLSTSWFDSAGIPSLNRHNVLNYFSQRSNPFYDRTCNNEVVKMQRGDPAQLVNMQGIEYMLLHVQEPILYVIRKVHRQATDRVTPLADYYVLGGTVYQCPDIWSIINSRLEKKDFATITNFMCEQLSTVHLVNKAFTEFLSCSRYDPNRGYYWEFPDDSSQKESVAPSDGSVRAEGPGEIQRRRVDNLLNDLVKKFPPRAFAKKDGGKPTVLGEKQERRPTTDSKEGITTSGPPLPIPPVGIKRQGSEGKIPDAKRKRT